MLHTEQTAPHKWLPGYIIITYPFLCDRLFYNILTKRLFPQLQPDAGDGPLNVRPPELERTLAPTNQTLLIDRIQELIYTCPLITRWTTISGSCCHEHVNVNLSMEKIFPTGNQIIDTRIRYANEPGFGACVLPSQSVNEPCFTKK